MFTISYPEVAAWSAEYFPHLIFCFSKIFWDKSLTWAWWVILTCFFWCWGLMVEGHITMMLAWIFLGSEHCSEHAPCRDLFGLRIFLFSVAIFHFVWDARWNVFSCKNPTCAMESVLMQKSNKRLDFVNFAMERSCIVNRGQLREMNEGQRVLGEIGLCLWRIRSSSYRYTIRKWWSFLRMNCAGIHLSSEAVYAINIDIGSKEANNRKWFIKRHLLEWRSVLWS